MGAQVLRAEGGTHLGVFTEKKGRVPQASLSDRDSQEEQIARPALGDKGRMTKTLLDN